MLICHKTSWIDDLKNLLIFSIECGRCGISTMEDMLECLVLGVPSFLADW